MDPQELAERAKKAAGNHRRFESFGWHDRPEDDDQWCIVYTHHRDSGLCDQSNAAVIAKAMEAFPEEDCRAESHNHWAVGWIDGYAIRVYDTTGAITPAFAAWCELQGQLEDYPLLDEADHSRREYEATLEGIEQAGRRMLREGALEDWASRCFSWFWDHNQSAVESRDDQGGYPSDEDMRECLEALGLLESEDA